MSLWAITAYFNPIRYQSRRSAYKVFQQNLRVPLVTVELSFDGQFDVQKDDANILIQISGGAVAWQTQRLLNIALKHVPSDVNKIAWMDCDIIFADSDWPTRVEDALENYSYIQPFSNAIMLRRGEQLKDQSSNYEKRIAVTKLCRNGDLDILAQRRGHDVPFAMLAWAARRDCLQQHNFYDAAIVGGADMLFFSAINNKPDFAIWRFNLNNVFAEHYARWAAHIPKPSFGNFGCIDGEIWHLWHGELVNRHRTSRWNLVTDFNPFLDIKLSDNEVWDFTEKGKRLEAGIKSFFISRQEDG